MTEQEIEEVCARLFQWFWALQCQGFTEEQSLKLCVFLLTDGL